MKKRFFGAFVIVFVMAISSAFAASGSTNIRQQLNKSYSSGNIIVGNLTISAVGTTTAARTTAVNRSSYSCCISSRTREMVGLTVISEDSDVVNQTQGGATMSSIQRHSTSPGYKCVHYAFKYGVTNPSYCNSSTLVDDYQYTAYN